MYMCTETKVTFDISVLSTLFTEAGPLWGLELVENIDWPVTPSTEITGAYYHVWLFHMDLRNGLRLLDFYWKCFADKITSLACCSVLEVADTRRYILSE